MSTDLYRRYGNLLRPDGTNQLQRLPPALDADHVVPDGRTLSDLLAYVHRIAAEVRWVSLSGQASGDWRPLFEPLLRPGTDEVLPEPELQALLATRRDWPPHLVLLLTFLHLFRHLQADLNALPRRHLLHHYGQVLGLQRRAAVPDAVHVLFELAPGAAPVLLPAGTRLDAGKDALGQALVYTTQADLVVNAAQVADLRRLGVERDARGVRRCFVAGPYGADEGAGHTFGRSALAEGPGPGLMTEVALGFVVAAPILALAEGERRVTLRAHLRPAPSAPPLVAQGLAGGLAVTLSGADGWLQPDTLQAALLADGGQGLPALVIELGLGEAAAAVVAPQPALHGDGLAGAAPALRCLVTGAGGLYELFDGCLVDRVELAVDVRGVRQLTVQNDDAVLPPGKPMPLFGSQPRLGSSCLVGSAEVFGKRLSGLAIRLAWKSPPADLFNHYRAYFDNVAAGLSDVFHTLFRADAELLYEREFHRFLFGAGLFGPVTSAPVVLQADASAFTSALAGQDYREQPGLSTGGGYDGSQRHGFMRLRLTDPDRADTGAYAVEVPFEAFGHASFAPRYAVQALALSQWTAPAEKPRLPREPYTPVLASLALDYRATAELRPGDEGAAAWFNVEPFGLRPARGAAQAHIVAPLDGRAALHLGVAGFVPPGNLTLHFQIDAGTATAAEVLASGETQWAVLGAQDRWLPLDASAVLGDGTEGFQRSGVVALTVPADAATQHRTMPAGLVWLRARIDKPPEAAARTLALRTQAVAAAFDPGALPLSAYAAHLQAGLPAGRIAKPVQRQAAIRRVEQPEASFGGLGDERTEAYLQRAAERLRHRRRAVTPWDFERLVLERFPEVFKVKCLPHAGADGAPRAGHAAMVVVPNLRRGGGNALEPRAGEVLLARVRAWVAGLASPFAALHVIRPAFERVRVAAKVVFRRGRDPGYHASLLNDALCRFLSPWAYEDGEDILFGARIYRSAIVAFIEKQPYVDHLVGLRLFHQHAGADQEGLGWMRIGHDFIVQPRPRPAMRQMVIGDDFIVGRAVEAAETTAPHAILVSHPRHLITPVAAGAETCAGVTVLGIGYMTVGLDFDLTPEPA